MYSLISSFLLLLFALSSVHAAVGPIRPDLHPDTALEEAVRNLRLSVDQEKLYLARLKEHKSLLVRQSAAETAADEDDGFTEDVNDGTDVFEPILPGASVPPADEFEPTDEPEVSPDDSLTPSPVASVEPIPSLITTPEPFESPEVSPVVTPTPISVLPPLESPEVPPVALPSLIPEFSPELLPNPEISSDVDIDDVLVATPEVSIEVSPAADDPADAAAPSEDDEDDGVCFPATAKVQLQDGSVIAMEDVKLGDRVKVGHNQFSEVFMFTHKLANVRYSFLKIDTASGHSLTLTKSHYLYVNGLPAAASTVKIGDTLEITDKSVSEVVKVDRVFSRGLYNPQTTHGDIIVDNVRATTYTTTVDRGVAHALLAPLRAAYCTAGWSLTAFDAGAKMLAGLVPSGSLI